MESQKSFANRKTVNPECQRFMRADVESFFTWEGELLHRKVPSSPFYRVRYQISLCHVLF